MVMILQAAVEMILHLRETTLELEMMHVERREEGLSRESVGLLKGRFRRESGVHSHWARRG
jgi:hypothetical protein